MLSIHGLGDGFSLQVVADDGVMVPGGRGGGTPDFKWQGWSIRGKNQNPEKSLDQNLTHKKSNVEFPSHQKFPECIKWYNYHESSIVLNTVPQKKPT